MHLWSSMHNLLSTEDGIVRWYSISYWYHDTHTDDLGIFKISSSCSQEMVVIIKKLTTIEVNLVLAPIGLILFTS